MCLTSGGGTANKQHALNYFWAAYYRSRDIVYERELSRYHRHALREVLGYASCREVRGTV